jgi:hypothetical protein
MAIALLKFDLNDPEDEIQHKRAIKSLDMMLCFWDISQYLRQIVKYEDNSKISGDDMADKIKEKFHEILDEHGISIDELLG